MSESIKMNDCVSYVLVQASTWYRLVMEGLHMKAALFSVAMAHHSVFVDVPELSITLTLDSLLLCIIYLRALHLKVLPFAHFEPSSHHGAMSTSINIGTVHFYTGINSGQGFDFETRGIE